MSIHEMIELNVLESNSVEFADRPLAISPAFAVSIGTTLARLFSLINWRW